MIYKTALTLFYFSATQLEGTTKGETSFKRVGLSEVTLYATWGRKWGCSIILRMMQRWNKMPWPTFGKAWFEWLRGGSSTSTWLDLEF